MHVHAHTYTFIHIHRGCAANTKGTAFVVYEDIFDAKNACEHLSGFNVCNRYLVVLYYQPHKVCMSVGVGGWVYGWVCGWGGCVYGWVCGRVCMQQVWRTCIWRLCMCVLRSTLCPHVCLAFTFDVWCMIWGCGQVMTGKSNSECFLTCAANLSKRLMPTSQHHKHHITLQSHGSWCTD